MFLSLLVSKASYQHSFQHLANVSIEHNYKQSSPGLSFTTHDFQTLAEMLL